MASSLAMITSWVASCCSAAWASLRAATVAASTRCSCCSSALIWSTSTLPASATWLTSLTLATRSLMLWASTTYSIVVSLPALS